MFFVIMSGYAISGPVWWLIKVDRQRSQAAREKKNNIN
jgi:hypothetical protein